MIELIDKAHDDALTLPEAEMFIAFLKQELRAVFIDVLDDMKTTKEYRYINGQDYELIAKTRYHQIDRKDLRESAKSHASWINHFYNPSCFALYGLTQELAYPAELIPNDYVIYTQLPKIETHQYNVISYMTFALLKFS